MHVKWLIKLGNCAGGKLKRDAAEKCPDESCESAELELKCSWLLKGILGRLYKECHLTKCTTLAYKYKFGKHAKGRQPTSPSADLGQL